YLSLYVTSVTTLLSSSTLYLVLSQFLLFFFLNLTATPKTSTLSLHDALPISLLSDGQEVPESTPRHERDPQLPGHCPDHRETKSDRKSTRLNSSHGSISYAVFCLKKKKRKRERTDVHQSNQQLINMNEKEPHG